MKQTALKCSFLSSDDCMHPCNHHYNQEKEPFCHPQKSSCSLLFNSHPIVPHRHLLLFLLPEITLSGLKTPVNGIIQYMQSLVSDFLQTLAFEIPSIGFYAFFVIKPLWLIFSVTEPYFVSDLLLSPSSEFFILRFLKLIHWEWGGGGRGAAEEEGDNLKKTPPWAKSLM